MAMKTMADVTTLRVYKDMQSMTLRVFKVVENMPRANKYDVGHRMKNLCLDCIEKITEANMSSGNERSCVLSMFAIKFKVFEMVVELAHQLKMIPDDSYIKLKRESGLIARQAEAWKDYTIRLSENRQRQYGFGESAG